MNPVTVLPLVVAGIAFYVGHFHLSVFAQRKRHREDLFFALTCFASGCYDILCSGLYRATSVSAATPWSRGQMIAVSLVTTAMMWFVTEYAGRKHRVLVYGYSAFALAAIIVQAVDRSPLTWVIEQPSVREAVFLSGARATFYEPNSGPFTLVQMLAGLTVAVCCLWTALRARRTPFRQQCPLPVALVILCGAALNDIAISQGLYHFIYLTEYAFFALLMCMSFALSQTVARNAMAEERFRALLETTSDWVWELDRDLRYSYASPRVTELLGYEPSEVVGTTPFDRMPLEEARRLRPKIEALLESGRPLRRVETLEWARDGRLVHFETSAEPVRDDRGNPRGYRGISRDVTDRIGIEMARRESDELFRTLVENSPTGIFLVDDAYRFEYVNDQTFRILGYASDELIGRDFRSVLGEGSRDLVAERYRRRQRGEEIISRYEIDIVRRDGSSRRVELVAPALMTGNGTKRTMGQILDITEREATEEALRKAHEETERLKEFNESIVQGVAEAIFIHDERGALTFMNPAAESLLGCPARQLRGRRWDELLATPRTPPEGTASPSPPTVTRYEAELRDCQGRTIPVIVSAQPLRLEGPALGTLSACTDISDRIRSERLLRALNRAALSMARAMTHDEVFAAVARECSDLGYPCILLIFDERRQVLRVQYLGGSEESVEPYRRMTGKAPEAFEFATAMVPEEWERLGRGETIVVDDGAAMLSAVVPDIDIAQARQLARDLGLSTCVAAPLIGEKLVTGVFVMGSAGLQERDVPAIAAIANQIAAAWHKNDLLLELHRKLRELKEVQDQLVHAQKMEAMGRLAGGMAHDFNNQLMVIIGNAEMLCEKSGTDDRIRHEIEEILSVAQQSTQLTQQLLAFSRRQASQPVNLDPRQLVRDMERMLRRLLDENIELTLGLHPDTGWVNADPGQLMQVLMNLVMNARDAMPNGGRLRIATGSAAFDRAVVSGRTEIPPGRYAVLTVSDTGTGMDAGVMEHLFEPFFTTKPTGLGTGLGLSIVHGIVTQSAGVVTVASEPGRGSTFTVYLPRIEPPAPASAPAPPKLSPNGKGETLLVVEDEVPLNRMLTQALVENGYRVHAAMNGEEAIKIAEQCENPLDLVLTDVFMPGTVSSKDLIDRLVLRHPRIRIILMSGYTDDVIVRHGVLRPGRRFLAKPFSRGRLLDQVRTTLDDR